MRHEKLSVWSQAWPTGAAALAIVPIAFGMLVQPAIAADTHEVTVTVHKVNARDKLDELSKADLFARVTINGKSQVTDRVKQDNEINPNWKISAGVPKGKVDIKLELIDKDIAQDDLIDINVLDAKRVQDFAVNTKTCRVTGFSGSPKCGTKITRAGKEKKSAEITFSVDVKKKK